MIDSAARADEADPRPVSGKGKCRLVETLTKG